MITVVDSFQRVATTRADLGWCVLCGRRLFLQEKEEGVDDMRLVQRLWSDQEGQDIAEYAVMLAVILVIVVGTVRLIGSNAQTVFSQTASSIQ